MKLNTVVARKISWQKDLPINDNDTKYGRGDIVDIVGGTCNIAARTMEQAAEAALGSTKAAHY